MTQLTSFRSPIMQISCVTLLSMCLLCFSSIFILIYILFCGIISFDIRLLPYVRNGFVFSDVSSVHH